MTCFLLWWCYNIFMKVGDLVKYEQPLSDSMDKHATAYGLVIMMSRTGHQTESAQVLFKDGVTAWFDSQVLEVVNESR